MIKSQANNNKLVKILKKLLPLIGIIIFIFLIVGTGPDKIITTFSEVSPIIIVIVIALTIPRILLNNYIWQIILKKQKISISFFKSLKILLIGRFYGYISPGNLGKYAKVLYMKDATKEPSGKLFVNIVINEVINSFSFYFIFIISSFLIMEKYPEMLPGIILYSSIIAAFYMYFIKKERGEKTFQVLIKYLIPKRLQKGTFRFTKTFYNDFPRTRDFVFPFIIGLLVQIIIWTQLYIIALFFGVNIHIFNFIVFYSIASIIGIIPISIGGLGTREAALVVLFTSLGVEPNKIIAISLTNYILSGLLTGFAGLGLAVLEAKNNKKPLRLKNPLIFLKKYLKNKIDDEHLLK